jgi:cytoskeleton protein RodZ
MDPGARLRQARLARGLSLDMLATTTRIAPDKLAAIERNDLSVFPPGPYARGFVRAYAAEVGLDPDDTAREYLAQFHVAPPSSEAGNADTIHAGLPSRQIGGGPWRGPTLAAAAVLAFVIAWVAWPGSSQSGRDAPREPGAIGTAGTAVVPVGRDAAPLPAERLHPDPPDLPATGEPATLTVTLEAEHPVWVSASADGERMVFRTLQAGEREVVRATREIVLRVGDAGALRWSRGSGPTEVMGPRGAVRTLTLTPDGTR